MKVKDIMSTNISCVREDTPIAYAALHMKSENIGSIPVCDNTGRLKGIVTDRDIVVRLFSMEGLSKKQEASTSQPILLSHILTGDIMTSSPVTVTPDMDIHDAALLFSAYKIRRLPVVEASRLIGMLSLGDIASKPIYIDEAGDALSAISLQKNRQE